MFVFLLSFCMCIIPERRGILSNIYLLCIDTLFQNAWSVFCLLFFNTCGWQLVKVVLVKGVMTSYIPLYQVQDRLSDSTHGIILYHYMLLKLILMCEENDLLQWARILVPGIITRRHYPDQKWSWFSLYIIHWSILLLSNNKMKDRDTHLHICQSAYTSKCHNSIMFIPTYLLI